jgi:hypothetical protein
MLRAVDLPPLQLQILRCIPQTTRRLHEVRRRLALAFFFKDDATGSSNKYTSDKPHCTLVLSEVAQQLEKSQFKINKDTNYPELAALMSILDIALDNGLSIEHKITGREGEVRFNEEVDDLAARIKQIWGSINDAGASFMSRINAKEVIQGLRMRLEHVVRTKPKPKLSIFDRGVIDEKETVHGSSAWMERFVKKTLKEID